MHSRSSLENHTFSDRNGPTTIPFGAAYLWHTYYSAYMREYPPGLHSTHHNTNLPSNLKNVALAYEPSVEKNRASYISKNDPIPVLSVFGSRDWRSDAPYLPVGSTAASSKR